jgi:hypothetical protein
MTAPSGTALGFDRSSWPHLSDPEWFALAWYGQTIAALCKPRGLRPVRPELPPLGPAARLPGFRSGHLVAVSPDLLDPSTSLADAVVAGGPCIGDCQSRPTLEALYDTVQVLLAARALDLPALLFVGDEEEGMERGNATEWERLGERFARWLPAIAAVLGVAEVAVVRTSGSVHADALARLGQPARGIEPARIDAAFHLGAGVPRPLVEESRRVTRRVIEAHLPEVVSRHLGRTVATVVIAENLQQAGVFEVARDLAAGRGGGQVALAAHWPAPAVSGSERMYRSGAWDKVAAADLELVAAGTVTGIHPYTSEFFRCWLGPEERSALAATARAAW